MAHDPNKDLMKILQQLSDTDPHPDEEKTRDTFTRAPFGWPGGKSRSLKHLLPLLPVRGNYVETCGGSGIVLLNRRKSPLEVFNDRYSGVTSFYRCLQNKDDQVALSERLSVLIHSREEFIWCRDSWKNCGDTVERAARWYYTIKSSFGSIGRNWGRALEGFAMIGPKLREGIVEFPIVHGRFKDVQIENLDALRCIEDYDQPDTVTYIDPDYLDSARGHYEHQMDERYHEQLLKSIFDGRGFFAISGYANKMYDELEWTSRHEWDSFVSATPQAFDEGNNKTDGVGGRSNAREVLWIKDHQA